MITPNPNQHNNILYGGGNQSPPQLKPNYNHIKNAIIMTQQEFKTRTNIDVDVKDFAQIHDIYMATNLDKDEFCREFKDYGKSQIICHLYNTIIGQRESIKDLEKQIYKEKEMRDMAEETTRMNAIATGEFLTCKAYENNDEDLRARSIELMGEKEYIRYLIEEDFNLTREDRQLASKLLK